MLDPMSKVVKTYLETLKWEVLPYPPYFPEGDVAPSDYHLFRSMTHGLADQHFRSDEEVKNWIDSWIASKDDQFFRRGIRTLPERWEKVVGQQWTILWIINVHPVFYNKASNLGKKRRKQSCIPNNSKGNTFIARYSRAPCDTIFASFILSAGSSMCIRYHDWLYHDAHRDDRSSESAFMCCYGKLVPHVIDVVVVTVRSSVYITTTRHSSLEYRKDEVQHETYFAIARFACQ